MQVVTSSIVCQLWGAIRSGEVVEVGGFLCLSAFGDGDGVCVAVPQLINEMARMLKCKCLAEHSQTPPGVSAQGAHVNGF